MALTTTQEPVEFYEIPDHGTPALEFINTLDNASQAHVFTALKALQLVGRRHLPLVKRLDKHISEARISCKNVTVRILFFHHKGKLILTNGFTKKTRKTPARELTRARDYRDQYLSTEATTDRSRN